jgi:hypothetical protein
MSALSADRHVMQHAGLDRLQERIDRLYEHDYANAKRLKLHAPRQWARKQSHSQRNSQYYAWRTHLHAHGVRVPTFATLDELKRLHDDLHRKGDDD